MTVATDRRRKPRLKNGDVPVWWNPKGAVVELINLNVHDRILECGSTAVEVRISRLDPSDNTRWCIDWKLKHDLREVSQGRRVLHRDTVRRAFGLDGLNTWERGNRLLDRYGADAGDQGSFIRWGVYLNIPCPGTGQDADPNVSIELYDVLCDAVRVLLEMP